LLRIKLYDSDVLKDDAIGESLLLLLIIFL